jgi:glycosyltransferase involved in cell wall biosynthesis
MGRVAFEYVERLRARGHNVHVFTPRYRRAGEDPDYVHRVPSPISVGNAGVVPSLFHRLKGFDVIHLHYPFFGGAEPVIVRKAIRPDQALVMTYHMDPVAPGVRGAIFEAHRRLLFPWIVGRCDAILVSSKSYAETCALSRLPHAMEKVEIHPFGVDLERFFPGTDAELRAQIQVADATPLLVFVGGLDAAHHFKGLPVLLDALRDLQQPRWHLAIIGDGELRPVYESQVEAHGLTGRVSFLGAVPDDELPRWYRAGDIHVFPSTERAEAFGLVALEAAASGIPTIASNLAGVSSVVLDGETGLLVPPHDVKALTQALELLLVQVDVRERLGEAARKRAEADFAWEPLVSTLEDVYRRVTAKDPALRAKTDV